MKCLDAESQLLRRKAFKLVLIHHIAGLALGTLQLIIDSVAHALVNVVGALDEFVLLNVIAQKTFGGVSRQSLGIKPLGALLTRRFELKVQGKANVLQ